MAGLKTSIDQEKIIFAYALKRPQYLAHMGGDFFTNADIQYLANCAKLFFQEYKESPSCEQMKSIIKGDKKELAPEIVDSIYDVEINAYEEEWLQNITEGWIKFRLFNHNMFAAATLIKTADITLDNVNEIVERALEQGIKLVPISRYYNGEENRFENTFVMNYSSIKVERIEEIAERLYEALGQDKHEGGGCYD